MSALIPYVAGTALATAFSTGLLALPAAIGVRRLIRARLQAPFSRDAVERNLVLASALAGAAGAVLCADGAALAAAPFPQGSGEMAALLLGFVAPAPLAAVPWVAGEMLSGPSLRSWRSLAASVAVACALSWATFAWLWPNEPQADLSPELALIQFMACIVAALGAGQTYLALRGEPIEALPPAAVALERL
jgi:hypothetical protein